MTQYVKKTFEHAWQAIKFFEDGGKLFIDSGSELKPLGTAPDVLRYLYRLYIAKPTDWREQLDGTVENGVLCWVGDSIDCPSEECGDLDIVTCFVDGWFQNKNECPWRYATPLTQSEIDKFKGNAPV